MDHLNHLAASVAEECADKIQGWLNENAGIEETLTVESCIRPQHLLWMCKKIRHKVDWPPTKLHRWIGFIQCAMICLGVTDLEGAKDMVSIAKTQFAEDEDEDLKDHNDPESPFRLDIGGES